MFERGRRSTRNIDGESMAVLLAAYVRLEVLSSHFGALFSLVSV